MLGIYQSSIFFKYSYSLIAQKDIDKYCVTNPHSKHQTVPFIGGLCIVIIKYIQQSKLNYPCLKYVQ